MGYVLQNALEAMEGATEKHLSVEIAPTHEASMPTARCRKPPIFPWEYISAAFSSNRRIRSMW